MNGRTGLNGLCGPYSAVLFRRIGAKGTGLVPCGFPCWTCSIGEAIDPSTGEFQGPGQIVVLGALKHDRGFYAVHLIAG